METISDIVAQMRGRGEDGRMDRRLWLDYADRIEAAAKRDDRASVGNAAAIREALVELTDKVLDYLHKGLIQLPLPLENATAKARAALSAPPRQCDVGTAEEQTRRMAAEYCAVQNSCYESPSGRECPLYKKGIDCRLIWAQMPYEAKEGGAE